jgi:hypothetical protein
MMRAARDKEREQMELESALAAQESSHRMNESDARAGAQAIDEMEAFVVHEEAEMVALVQVEEMHEPGLIPEVVGLGDGAGSFVGTMGPGTDEMMVHPSLTTAIDDDDSDDEWPTEFVQCACTLGPSRCTVNRNQGRRPCLMFSARGWLCSGCCVGCGTVECRCWCRSCSPLEASKALLLAAQGAVKAAEEAVAAAAEADFRGKAVLLAAQGAVKATEEAVAAAAEAEYFICIGRL